MNKNTMPPEELAPVSDPSQSITIALDALRDFIRQSNDPSLSAAERADAMADAQRIAHDWHISLQRIIKCAICKCEFVQTNKNNYYCHDCSAKYQYVRDRRAAIAKRETKNATGYITT